MQYVSARPERPRPLEGIVYTHREYPKSPLLDVRPRASGPDHHHLSWCKAPKRRKSLCDLEQSPNPRLRLHLERIPRRNGESAAEARLAITSSHPPTSLSAAPTSAALEYRSSGDIAKHFRQIAAMPSLTSLLPPIVSSAPGILPVTSTQSIAPIA